MTTAQRLLFVDLPAIVEYSPTGELRIDDLRSGRTFDASGVLAAAAFEGLQGHRAGPLLEALGPEHPLVGAVEAMAAGTRVELTPSAVLRLDGFGTLFVELTGACNERCVHCYAESGPEVAVALDRQSCLEVLDDAAELGFERVQLTGGDPLLCRFLPQLLEHALALGIPTREVYTNGLALDRELLARIAPLDPALAFSFYSHDPAVHDAITRTPDSQRRTLAAIRRACEAGLSVRVSVIVMEHNAAHVPRTIELLRELGVEHVGAGNSHAVGRGALYEDDGWRQDGGTSAAPDSDAAGAGGGGDHSGATRAGPRGKLCVAYDGRVLPCIFNRTDELGRLSERRLREIVADPRLPARASSAEVAVGPRGFADRLSCGSCQLTAYALRRCRR